MFKAIINKYFIAILALTLVAGALAGCSSNTGAVGGDQAAAGEATLVVGAYSVAKDALQELLPLFESKWAAETGQSLHIEESYEASGTQARAIIGGFEADIAILAMEGDIDMIADAGFITHDWRQLGKQGMLTRSIVVLGTREGNPLNIQGWDDLTKEGVKVLYPNPKTSGGAQWDINAMYGAGLKQAEQQLGAPDPEYAKNYLKQIHANVESLDKSGRASMAAFEYGVGDVIVTYENELLARIAKGVEYDIVVPEDTILIENPIALVDKHIEQHGNREVVEAFYQFLLSEEAQRIFVKHGFRPVEETVAEETKDQFVIPAGLFNISYLGGWDYVREELYSKRGIWYQVLANL